MIRLTVPTEEAMVGLGRRIGGLLRASDLVMLRGDLGAGKTTLTRGIGEAMGVRGPITSPTFVLSRVHPPVSGSTPLLHVDAYRLSSPTELDDLDLDFEGAAAVVEWGDGLLDGVTDAWLHVTIERGRDDDARAVTIVGHGARWADLTALADPDAPQPDAGGRRPQDPGAGA